LKEASLQEEAAIRVGIQMKKMIIVSAITHYQNGSNLATMADKGLTQMVAEAHRGGYGSD